MNARHAAARLRRMSREELAFRLRVAARAEVGRVAAACREPRWRVTRLASRLDPAAPLVRQAIERLDANDLRGAHARLRQHFRTRVSRFPVSPDSLADVRKRVLRDSPGSAAEARAEVERLRRGRFDLLGYRDLAFAAGVSTGPAAIDWHEDPVHRRRAPAAWWSRVRFLDPSVGDHKIIWELNRHQHFLRLGRAAWLTRDPVCLDTLTAHLRGWLAQNPPGVGINWASTLELGLRSLSWLWALHLFASLPPGPDGGDAVAGEAPWIPDLLLGLDTQLQHVRRNLSRYFSPNTHLTGEALALYVCGRALPELRAASAWADAGREVLVEQIGVQVTPDGGHCERSTHYLRYTLDFYLMALAFARATGDLAAAAPFEEACGRLAEATRALSDSNGRLPLLGDDDGGRLWPMRHRDPADVRDSLAIAAIVLDRPGLAIGPLPEEASWLLGSRPQDVTSAMRSNAGADSMGYFVARPRPDDHLVIDAGPHGFLNGGHAHADALSLVYTVGGRPLAIDPGTFSYTMSPLWRDRLRLSAWHNTLTLDRRSQSVPDGPFHWRTTAAARGQAWDAGSGCTFFEGVHDGYLPLVHRRRLAALPGLLVVVDSVLGDGDGHHLAEVHWHIDGAWRARREAAGHVVLEHERGAGVELAPCGAEVELVRGDEATGLGWQSPVYGRLVPCTTVRLAAAGSLPLVVVSVFAERGDAPVTVDRVLPATEVPESEDDSVAIRLGVEGRIETVLFTSPGRERRFDLPEGTLTTDARFTWLTSGAGHSPQLRAAVEGRVAVEEVYVRDRGIRRG